MANQQIKRLWRRRPEVEEADFELLQSRVRARLLGTDGATDDTPAADDQADDGDALDTPAADADRAADDAAGGSDAGARVVPVEATTAELPDVVVGVMAARGDPLWDVPASVLWPEPGVEPAEPTESEAAVEPEEPTEPAASIEPAAAILADIEVEPAAIPEPEAAKPRRTRATSKHAQVKHAQVKAVAKPAGRSRAAATTPAHAVHAPPATPTADATAPPADPPVAVTEPAIAPALPDPVPARPRRPGPPRRSGPVPASRPHVAASTPYCPYCALLLDPPPESSRRCPRCRERIIVKRVDGRAIYLTEAAVLSSRPSGAAWRMRAAGAASGRGG